METMEKETGELNMAPRVDLVVNGEGHRRTEGDSRGYLMTKEKGS